MVAVLSRNLAPILALFIFVLGMGFFSTFISMVLTHRGVDSLSIGLMTTFFYAGLLLGAFRIERLIARVSHIRAYAAFASALAVIVLLHGLVPNVYFWMLLRFVGGMVTAGIFIVVESWLLCQSTPGTRGQMLSLYMIVFYAAQSLGQFFLNLYDDNLLFMVVLMSMSCSLSVLPMAITYSQSPSYSEPSTLSLKHLFKRCASGLFGCFVAGLVMGVIYGLLPVFYIHQFHDAHTVAILMFTVIFGGMILQFPVGRLSDVIERRLVLLFVCLASIFSIALMAYFSQNFMGFVVLLAIFGGLTFTLYPVSISYACDSLDSKDIVAGTQTLLVAYSFGAMVGPMMAPFFMKSWQQYGLYAYFIVVLAVLSVLLAWRKTTHPNKPHEEAYLAYPPVTPVSSEVDPRGESDLTECRIGKD